jgi:hypothetical protein
VVICEEQTIGMKKEKKESRRSGNLMSGINDRRKRTRRVIVRGERDWIKLWSIMKSMREEL